MDIHEDSLGIDPSLLVVCDADPFVAVEFRSEKRDFAEIAEVIENDRGCLLFLEVLEEIFVIYVVGLGEIGEFMLD